MTLILNDADVCGLLTMEAVLDALDAAAKSEAGGESFFTERANLMLPNGWMRMAPAALTGLGVMGYKEFHSTAGVGVRFTVNLFDYETGESLASMDGRRITEIRTGAAGGLAVRHCASPHAATVAVLGSGSTARSQLAAAAAVRPLRSGRVFSPTPAHRKRFCEEMGQELGIDLVPMGDARQAVEGADVVLVATDSSGAAVFFGDWLNPGVHVNSIGSTLPDQRELDVSVWPIVTRVVVDTPGVIRDSGDAIAAREAGVLDEGKVVELHGVVAGTASGRDGADDVTLYKSVGTALQDVAVAHHVYLEAVCQGIGHSTPEHVSVKTDDWRQGGEIPARSKGPTLKR